MAKGYTKTGIYLPTYQLSVVILRSVAGMRRDYRPFVGDRLEHLSSSLILKIYEANRSRCPEERAGILEAFEKDLQEVKLKLRQGRDVNVISITAYTESIKLLKEAEENCVKWRNYCKRRTSQ